ncbi:MAG: hypothetical protein CMK09_15200 [Ponticaulis sp.]|nr:hypothetical protein [Ponticaulis sp.]
MIRKILLAGCASAAIATPAMAQEIEVSGNIAIQTEYVWRGVTQSNGDLAVSGGFDLASGNFYAGTWMSNVDFEDSSDTNIEWDFYAGFGNSFGDTTAWWDVGIIYYAYPDSGDLDYDFVELYGGVGNDFDNGFGVSGYIYWDPDNESFYVEGAAGFAVTDSFGVDASIGNYSFDGGGDYTAFSFGGTYSTPVGVDLDLRYWDADASGVDDTFVLTVSKSL